LDNNLEEIIKEESTKKNVIEFDKKIDKINPFIVNNTNNITINPIIEKDEQLDNDTINFFRDTLNNPINKNSTNELILKISNLIELIEKSNSLSNKHKNDVLRQMKDKFMEEQINLIGIYIIILNIIFAIDRNILKIKFI
jgi:hypothetical protein